MYSNSFFRNISERLKKDILHVEQLTIVFRPFNFKINCVLKNCRIRRMKTNVGLNMSEGFILGAVVPYGYV